MSGQKDDPDDLIAELTKLMAAETGKAGEAARPVSLPPAPPAQPASRPMPPQTIRIPGISQPVAAAPQPTDDAAAERGGREPAASPASAWQERLAGRQAGETHVFATPLTDRPEPASGNWRPALGPGDGEPQAPAGPAFEFDFGFNRQRPESPRPATVAAPPPNAGRPASGTTVSSPVRPQPVPPSGPATAETPAAPGATTVPAAPPPVAPAPVRDPIAELIAAELSAGLAVRPRPVTPPPAAVPVEEAPEDDEPEDSGEAAATSVQAAPVPASRPGNLAAFPVSPQRAPASAPATRPVGSAMGRPTPESDRFVTAPVFGLGNRPSGEQAPPRVELDPMDEIENLIGEAVRVELNAPPPAAPVRLNHEPAHVARQAPVQPAVPPLATGFAPRRTSLREPESRTEGAEEAILAAAAATGAEVGRIDTPYADERPQPRGKARRERPAREERRASGPVRQLVIPAIAGTLLLALGFGLYWALGMNHSDGKAPVLAADAAPAKTIPAKPADTTPHSVVMDELSGSTPPPAKETLVSRDQTAGTDPAQVAAVPVPAVTAAADSGDGGLANRKVRTVTVRPDGTIVSSDDSVAGAAKLPVDRPNVPTVPGAAAAGATDAPASVMAEPVVAPAPGATSAPAAEAAPTAPPTAPTAAPAAVGDPSAPLPMPRSMRPASIAVADSSAGGAAAPVSAVVGNGAQKPIDLIGNLVTADQTPQAQPAAQAARPTVEVTAAAGTGAVTPEAFNPVAHVQLSSQRSQGDAQASADALQRRFGKLFNGAKLSIVKVDLGAKGTYYRVMMPTSSLGDAQQLCTAIKQAGGDCVAGNG